MTDFDIPDGIFIDANGCLAERVDLDDLTIVMHYDDVPDSDLTVVRGMPCTTPVRSVLDAAMDVDDDQLRELVGECLDMGLFTPQEAFDRIAQPDMLSRQGAIRVARALVDLGHMP